MAAATRPTRRAHERAQAIGLKPLERDTVSIEDLGGGGRESRFGFALIHGRAQEARFGILEFLLAQENVVVGGAAGLKAGAFGFEVLPRKLDLALAKGHAQARRADASGRAQDQVAQLQGEILGTEAGEVEIFFCDSQLPARRAVLDGKLEREPG